MKDKEYLGDSVYVGHDGYHINLTTENGLPTDPSNTISLEPDVMAALVRYEARMVEKYKKLKDEAKEREGHQQKEMEGDC